MKAFTELETKFTAEQLKHLTFEWKQDEWLPEFDDFWRPSAGVPPTLEQVLQEYTSGVGLRLSIRELNTHWKGRWKRNIQKIKTESSKHTKIIELIEALSSKNNWSADIALTFLQETYPIPTKSTLYPFLQSNSKFISHL